jgi:hypothetical protein
MSPLQRLSAAALVPVATLVLASAASAATPSQSNPTESGTRTTKTRICVVKKTKRARVVRVTERCRRHETRMTWRKYQKFATNSAASSSGDAVVGVPGPQGLTGDQGPQGATGAQGVQGPQGVAGPQGPQGDRGETGPAGSQGPAGPSDIYTTTGTAGLTDNSEQTRASLNLPAGQYLLLGQANALSSSQIGQFFVTCRLRESGGPLGQSDTGFVDASKEDGAAGDGDPATRPHVANLFITAPLTTSGGTVRLTCQGLFGPLFPFVSNVQLTALKTGALHL